MLKILYKKFSDSNAHLLYMYGNEKVVKFECTNTVKTDADRSCCTCWVLFGEVVSVNEPLESLSVLCPHWQ